MVPPMPGGDIPAFRTGRSLAYGTRQGRWARLQRFIAITTQRQEARGAAHLDHSRCPGTPKVGERLLELRFSISRREKWFERVVLLVAS